MIYVHGPKLGIRVSMNEKKNSRASMKATIRITCMYVYMIYIVQLRNVYCLISNELIDCLQANYHNVKGLHVFLSKYMYVILVLRANIDYLSLICSNYIYKLKML